MSKHRLKPDARKSEIITVALALAAESHYQRLTRNSIAEAVGVTGPTIQYHFKTMTQLRTQVMRAAVKREVLLVLAQGLMACDCQALKAPQALRDAAFDAAVAHVNQNRVL